MVKIVVIGCGVIGLTTAIQLQKDIKNAHVTIVTEKMSPYTTGDVSAGFWTPYLLGTTPESKIHKWSKVTHDKLHELWKNGLASIAGITLQPSTKLEMEPGEEPHPPNWINIPFGGHCISEDTLERLNKNLNKKFTRGIHYVTFTCEPTKLLPFLLEEFLDNGGTLIMKTVKNFDELKDYDVIVNCTGPGAKDLVKDKESHPIRGQVIRVSAPWQFDSIFDESGDGYIIINMSEVILGGTHQVGDSNLSPDPEDKKKILKECTHLCPSLKTAKEIRDGVGLRPGRTSVRLECEKYLTGNGRLLNIVHNYGHGGAGVTLSFGCAQEVSDLVQTLIARTKHLSSRL